MWPDRLTSAFPPSSLHEPIKARERSRRSGPVTTHPDRIQPFRDTNGSTVPHSDADFAHQICGRDFVHAAIILKGTCVSLPQAPLHTNVISAVTQAAFTGRKAEGGGTAAIVHPVFTDVSHNYIFITEPFCRIANISVTFHSATVGNLFFFGERTWIFVCMEVFFKRLLGFNIWAAAILQKSNSGFSRCLAFIYFSITWRIDQAPPLSTGLSQRLSVCQSVARRFAYRRASSTGSQTITADK